MPKVQNETLPSLSVSATCLLFVYQFCTILKWNGFIQSLFYTHQRKFEGLTSELRILKNLFTTAKRSHSQEISQPRDLSAKRSHSQEISQPRSHSQEISQPKISQPRDLTAKRSSSQEISQPSFVLASSTFRFWGKSRTESVFER